MRTKYTNQREREEKMHQTATHGVIIIKHSAMSLQHYLNGILGQ